MVIAINMLKTAVNVTISRTAMCDVFFNKMLYAFYDYTLLQCLDEMSGAFPNCSYKIYY